MLLVDRVALEVTLLDDLVLVEDVVPVRVLVGDVVRVVVLAVVVVGRSVGLELLELGRLVRGAVRARLAGGGERLGRAADLGGGLLVLDGLLVGRRRRLAVRGLRGGGCGRGLGVALAAPAAAT